ncbi:hypothetical protein CNR22_16755 [Sphingobacteriaceae bacterium]|nr:hypothetical protein CNR22_16755 [Sphingobacteriaceae bacterium]
MGNTNIRCTVKKILIFYCLFLFSKICTANQPFQRIYILSEEEISHLQLNDFALISEDSYRHLNNRPTPLLQMFHKKQKKNKKLTAALLAFPFPFGIVGLHRIYLGCAPYVPVVYIGSFGGIVGLLPLIDFCFILLEKDMKPFTDNKKVFMWVN